MKADLSGEVSWGNANPADSPPNTRAVQRLHQEFITETENKPERECGYILAVYVFQVEIRVVHARALVTVLIIMAG
jgi:hypothetical protein